ncbi:glucose-6-phosphate dehydrogenase [Deinococcus wulumuqiensis]|uniref:Glucose-6-phosphate 1-dehydrogenase n=1 Tax=Deinococcus wulumuqiensis TaxID=980427 RepID=A0AAV4K6Z2_9DEIO|nr:glucose-6-phosphate dehydrogenase [Deinococcus wulumuqiensis]QII19838.1 glucose-6-phosphate dehydrogenase [Deinococcus wulumuqiensis R12]GGI89837.1 glucose-6-phosphate 1-dehydrogenase [Deinococcus wulumuqiensis]GGP30656.1 glucose-6-phosphate 1-dehydrogenase [Deinococcus wulumuqiensis]
MTTRKTPKTPRKAAEPKAAKAAAPASKPRKSRQRVPKSTDAGADGQNPFRAAMRRTRAPEPATLVIFGVTGDLARRKLLPAVFGLWQDGLLGSAFNIVGVGRQEMTDEQFGDYALEALKTSKETDAPQPGSLEKFRELLYYEYGEFSEDEVYHKVQTELDRAESTHGGRKNALFYLSTPPSLFEPISNGLGRVGLQEEKDGWRRLVIEKPFGRDLASARELNDAIHRVWDESQVYRIDHYLGKETVQNLMAIRFGNAIFEPLWNRGYVDHVQITASEDLGLEGRAGYYEEAGVVRDMLQNHLMQLFSLTAMEAPSAFEADAIRDEKVKVLRAVKPIPAERVPEVAVRGQYGPGTMAGEKVPGYKQEPDVKRGSRTPTYVALKLEVDNWRWQGVPFFLRTGKRLPKKVTEIAVVFKRPPLGLFPGGLERNVLAFRIQPDEGVSLKFSSKSPGQEMVLREVVMDFRYDAFGAQLESPYSRLLLDAMLGDATLFPREDEVDHAWQIVSGILEAWEGEDAPAPKFPNYPAGTWGPDEADDLIGAGRRWRRL